jgi:hypothetical protein
MQREKLLALGIAIAPPLLTIAQWATFRIVRRASQQATPGHRFAWTVGRLTAFAAFIAVAVVTLPAAFYAFLASIVVVPWPIAWPSAAALLLTGGTGIVTALLLFSKTPPRMSLIRVSGLINVVVLLWSSTQLRLLSGGPPDWFQPGVKYGSGRFEKRLLLNLHNIGSITDILYGNNCGAEAIELGVAGNYGARFFSHSLQLKSSVDFDVPKPYPMYSVDIVPQSNSNPPMFYRHSSWSDYDSLLDAQGKELWRTPYSCLAGTRVTASDESSAFLCVQSMPNCCTLEARNVKGNAIWDTRLSWVFNLAFLGPSATAPIVIDQSGSTLMGLNLQGQSVFSRRPVVSPLGGFSAVHWPGVCDQCLLVGGNGEFVVATPDGTKIVRHLTPAFYVSETRSVAVRLKGKTARMLGVLGQMEYKNFGNLTFYGVLFVFDSSGKQVYSEVFPENAEAIAAMPVHGHDEDVLLVGGKDKVWEYSVPGL